MTFLEERRVSLVERVRAAAAERDTKRAEPKIGPPTERQAEVLRLVHSGKTLREMAIELGINSTYAVDCHIHALVRKGLLVAHGARYAKTGRWKLTDAGLAAIGLRSCGACCGAGVVPVESTPPRKVRGS